MGERIESMNVKPSMFQAGISNKFTKRHISNFHDTTLTAASAAKQRAEKKIEKQADAIEKQQKKIENEMKKLEEITQKLHRQQVREAKRFLNRLHFAATRIQSAFRRSQEKWKASQSDAATQIQRRWRGAIARAYVGRVAAQRYQETLDHAAAVVARSVRVYACRLAREREIVEREYAAMVIQSVVRMVRAKKVYSELHVKRVEERARHCAATVIQCNVRSYMTRLIYLDVLYVICRIQAVIRGFLIRRRLQWVAAIDVDGICKFQAIARGFIVRQRLGHLWKLHMHTTGSLGGRDGNEDEVPLNELESLPQSACDSADDCQPGHHRGRASEPGTARVNQKPKLKASESKPSAAHLQPQVEMSKRSYWLPAGASFSKRLPVLSSKRTAIIVAKDDAGENSGDPMQGFDVGSRAFQARTPKKRNQKNRPARLAPVSLPGNTSARLVIEAETELQQVSHAIEEKLKREEELKLKLLCRKTQEKKKLEHEQKLRREQENEASERKLMEREEKLARLLLKVLHRRSKEVKIKKQTAEQHREERERIAMAREERHTRLLIKLATRQALWKKQHFAAPASSTAAATTSPSTRIQANKSRSELPSHGSSKPEKEDDDDMSFLDIDFKIPDSMHTRKASKIGKKPKKKLSRASDKLKITERKRGTGGGEGNQEEVHDEEDVPATVSAKSNAALKAELGVNEYEFDYGDDFEDVIDEAKLGRLIC